MGPAVSQCNCDERYAMSLLVRGASSALGSALFAGFEIALWGTDPKTETHIDGVGQLGAILGFAAGLMLGKHIEQQLFDIKCRHCAIITDWDQSSKNETASEVAAGFAEGNPETESLLRCWQ